MEKANNFTEMRIVPEYVANTLAGLESVKHILEMGFLLEVTVDNIRLEGFVPAQDKWDKEARACVDMYTYVNMEASLATYRYNMRSVP